MENNRNNFWVYDVIDGVPKGKRHISAIRLADRFFRLTRCSIPHWEAQITQGVPEGTRHINAVRLAGRYYGLGFSTKEVCLILQGWNRHNKPPMSQSEIVSIIASTKKWEKARYTPPMSDEEAREIIRAVKKQIREEVTDDQG